MSSSALVQARFAALAKVASRQPRVFERQVGGQKVERVSSVFGVHTFSLQRMQEKLPANVYERLVRSIQLGRPLDRDVAEPVAQAVKDWAVARGATHFTHWFQPMTGRTAEKHDAFLALDEQGRPLEKLTADMLIQSEPDASSFPSGGMRTTFEARGYTAWDPGTPMFLMDTPGGRTLCIPSVFVSYRGEPLDKKTPLLRSIEALDRQCRRLLALVGDHVDRVWPTLGCEQEYFLVDRALVALRPDLSIAGRALVGARPPKGQSMEDHYFGSIPPRILAFMQEVEFELYKLGVPAKTRHNEVAPSQFELAALHTDASRAVDHNQLIMEVLRRVAERHDLVVLLHEKPFPGINGSGKHSNWSIQDSRGLNLLDPGDTPHANLRFLSVLAAVLLGVHRHAALLRASIATHGNDFRLGANEAPPAILSVFLGDLLTRVVDGIIEGRFEGVEPEVAMIELGVSKLPKVARDNTDRNRTSPFAFTGNKFEFRAVGASQNPAVPITALNLAVADAMAELAGWIEEAGASEEAVMEGIRRALTEASPVRFEGNNYDPAWVEEAEARGLPHLRTAPEAIDVLARPETAALYERHGILTAAELASRHRVRVEQYITTVEIEVEVMRELVDDMAVPAAMAERAELAASLAELARLQAQGVRVDDAPERRRFEALSQALLDVHAARAALAEAVEQARAAGHDAHAWGRLVVPALERLGEAVNVLEHRVGDHHWPLLKTRELLFRP